MIQRATAFSMGSQDLADGMNQVFDWLEQVIEANPDLAIRERQLTRAAFVAFCDTENVEAAINLIKSEI